VRFRHCFFALLAALSIEAQVIQQAVPPGQDAVSDPPAGSKPAADCALSGIVVNAATGQPIARAMVALGGSRAPGIGSATDEEGRWSISGTTCAPVSPTATHAGFFKGGYQPSSTSDGAQTTQAEAVTVPLTPGSPLRDLKIALMPEGSIAGRVQDANGSSRIAARSDTMCCRLRKLCSRASMWASRYCQNRVSGLKISLLRNLLCAQVCGAWHLGHYPSARDGGI